MTVEALAGLVIDACESEQVEHMMVGAFAVSTYAVPRSTKDVDVLVSVSSPAAMGRLMDVLSPQVEFDPQVRFDTLTWGKRVVGQTRSGRPLKVELFEMFDDPFVLSEFARKQRVRSGQLGREVWLPTPEDLIVQKLRWGRPKDLEDTRDLFIVQGPETLDMAYIQRWCIEHKTTARLEKILAEMPPLD